MVIRTQIKIKINGMNILLMAFPGYEVSRVDFKSTVFMPDGMNRGMNAFHLLILLFTCALFLSGSFAEDMTRWHLPEGGKASLGSTAIRALTFSADGSQLAVARENGTALYDTYTGETLTLFPMLVDDVTALAFSPVREEDGGQTLASAAEDATVRLWNAHTGEHRTDFIGHTDPVVSLKFSPDGNSLASGSFREIRLWDLTLDGASRATVLRGHRDMVTALAFSPDSRTLASTSFYGTILLWDIETSQLRHSLSAHTSSILTLAFSPDNEILASGGYWSPDAESTISVWNPHTGQLLTTFETHTAPVFALAFSPDVRGVHGKMLATAGWDNTIRMWHPHTGALKAIFEGNTAPVLALAFLPDVYSCPRLPQPALSGGQDRTPGAYGKRLASVGLDGTIEVRSLKSGKVSWDVNSDAVVNILDLTFVVSRFGESSPDLNDDGVVNILDLTLVAQYIGKRNK